MRVALWELIPFNENYWWCKLVVFRINFQIAVPITFAFLRVHTYLRIICGIMKHHLRVVA